MTTTNTLKKEIEEAFGQSLSTKQLWVLVKLCKFVRLRCRNNAAFNNAFNVIFGPNANFRQIQKQRPDGSSYPGLEITNKIGNLAAETISEDEE